MQFVGAPSNDDSCLFDAHYHDAVIDNPDQEQPPVTEVHYESYDPHGEDECARTESIAIVGNIWREFLTNTVPTISTD